MSDATDRSFPQDFLRCGKPVNRGADPRFYRPSDAPISPSWSSEDLEEWEYWTEQERLATESESGE